jgi:hypothetical protein
MRVIASPVQMIQSEERRGAARVRLDEPGEAQIASVPVLNGVQNPVKATMALSRGFQRSCDG